MPAADVLKTLRGSAYQKSSPDEKGMDAGEPNETPRIISLTDDEKKAFEQAKPGDDLACEMHGNLEEDGHFHVMSVAPMGGGAQPGVDEKQMAGQVAERVMPGMAS